MSEGSFRLIFCCLILSLLMPLFGCGNKTKAPDFVSRLVPVSGTVTLDGEPLEKAMVTFHPDIQQAGGETAVGMTDSSGKYQVTTATGSSGVQTGVVPGRYQVTVSKIAMPDGSPLPPDTTDADAEAEGAKQVVPGRYSDFEQTTLTADVTEGPNVHDFELKSR